SSVAEAHETLGAWINGDARAGVSAGRRPANKVPNVVLVCSGVGSHWRGMGRDLLAKDATVRDALERCDAICRRLEGWSILDEMLRDDSGSARERQSRTQPMVAALQIALGAWWRRSGVEPAAVLGHSMGEVAAAHLTGALELEDAMRVICTRSRLL